MCLALAAHADFDVSHPVTLSRRVKCWEVAHRLDIDVLVHVCDQVVADSMFRFENCLVHLKWQICEY